MLRNWSRCPRFYTAWVRSRLHGHCVDTSALRAEADVIGGKADVEIEGLLSDPGKMEEVLALPYTFKEWIAQRRAEEEAGALPGDVAEAA